MLQEKETVCSIWDMYDSYHKENTEDPDKKDYVDLGKPRSDHGNRPDSPTHSKSIQSIGTGTGTGGSLSAYQP